MTTEAEAIVDAGVFTTTPTGWEIVTRRKFSDEEVAMRWMPQHVIPYDANGFGRHLHNVQDDSNGQRKPERKGFYEAVAGTLQHAERILLFGSGTGASSAMEKLLAELNGNHPDLAERVVGSIVINEQHLTENQLLAKARESMQTR